MPEHLYSFVLQPYEENSKNAMKTKTNIKKSPPPPGPEVEFLDMIWQKTHVFRCMLFTDSSPGGFYRKPYHFTGFETRKFDLFWIALCRTEKQG
jgi:hypothetical protein